MLTTDPFDPDEQIQTGEVTSKGFEAEATLELAAGLNAIVTYTYIYAIFILWKGKKLFYIE